MEYTELGRTIRKRGLAKFADAVRDGHITARDQAGNILVHSDIIGTRYFEERIDLTVGVTSVLRSGTPVVAYLHMMTGNIVCEMNVGATGSGADITFDTLNWYVGANVSWPSCFIKSPYADDDDGDDGDDGDDDGPDDHPPDLIIGSSKKEPAL